MSETSDTRQRDVASSSVPENASTKPAQVKSDRDEVEDYEKSETKMEYMTTEVRTRAAFAQSVAHGRSGLSGDGLSQTDGGRNGAYVETLRPKTSADALRTRMAAQNDRLDLGAVRPHLKPVFQRDIYTARYSLNK